MEKFFEEIVARLERLEAQNEIIRKELYGIRSFSKTNNSFGLMEAKTLREVVEETQFDVKTLYGKLTNIEKKIEAEDEMISKRNPPKIPSSRFVGNNEKKELAEDAGFEVVEIRSKTSEEENNWLKGKFSEMMAKSAIEEGASFLGKALFFSRGRTLETISNSIPLHDTVGTSCVLKLSNHLNVPLTDPQFYYFSGTKMTGPSVVAGHISEVFLGSNSRSSGFLCSFSINNSLRLVLNCGNDYSGVINFYIGFIPQNVPTDDKLHTELYYKSLTPDLCKNNTNGRTRLAELFVTTGQFLVRGHMKTEGPRAVVEVDIFEMTVQGNGYFKNNSVKHMSSNLKRTVENISSSLKTNQEITGETSVTVEVVNLLNVTLRSDHTFYSRSNHNNFMSTEVRPFHGLKFFVSADNAYAGNVQGRFSLEIESTDLSLVVGFKVEGKENRFAGAFLPRSAYPADYSNLMGENHWKSHEWRKSAQAYEGEKILEIRNIRAAICMSEGERSLLKIQVFAF